MCGIFGYAASYPLLTHEQVIRARDHMYARGPDDAGDVLLHVYPSSLPSSHVKISHPKSPNTITHQHTNSAHETWTALAHRRLSIMDLTSAGHQPFRSRCGRYHLVYNGELYQLDHLRIHLAQRNITLHTRCDTEILLHLLILYREKVFPLLNGMFAFAFWDQQEQSLLLARDEVGIKPLYYSVLDSSKPDHTTSMPIVFSSQVKALLSCEVISDELDLIAHLDYLSLTYTPSPQTSIKQIKQVPAGHYLYWTAHQDLVIDPYHTTYMQSRPYTRSWSALAKQLRHRLYAAVEARLVSDVSVGIFLSGGVDSSALLYAAQHVSQQALHTFTIKFAEQSFDESSYAQSVAQSFGSIHHETLVTVDPDEFMQDLIYVLDQPFADSSAIPLWYLCKTAKEHVTVALGGDGGDELLAGYRTHQAAMLAHYYQKLPSSMTDAFASWVQNLPVSHRKISWDLKLKQFTQANTDHVAKRYANFKNFLPQALKEKLCQPLYQRLYETSEQDSNIDQRQDDISRHFQSYFLNPDSSANLSAYLACDQGIYLPDNILTKADRVSMGHSLELRVPFLDPHVRRWINHLPSQYKWSLTQNKRLLKYALQGRVPNHVLTRSKAGFNVPMAQWLLGSLKPLCDDLLSAEFVKKVGVWDPFWVDYMRREHEERRQDFSRPLWAMLCFMMFNQSHRHGKESSL